MGMSNAERQALWRKRRKQELAALRNGKTDDALRDQIAMLEGALAAAKKELEALRNAPRKKPKPTAETLEKMRLGRERAKAQRKAWEEEKRIDAQEAAKRKRKAEALAGKTVANGCTPAEEAAAKAKLAEVLATPTKLEAARKASMDAMGAILRQGRKPLRNNRP
jgi:hypothetical protein